MTITEIRTAPDEKSLIQFPEHGHRLHVCPRCYAFQVIGAKYCGDCQEIIDAELADREEDLAEHEHFLRMYEEESFENPRRGAGPVICMAAVIVMGLLAVEALWIWLRKAGGS